MLELEHNEIDPGVEIISVSGRVMLGPESQQIESLVTELLAQGRKVIIFDISGVTHIDSTGIGRFIAALNQVMKARRSMFMAGATGQVRESFRVTRLDTIFQFRDSVESVRAALR